MCCAKKIKQHFFKTHCEIVRGINLKRKKITIFQDRKWFPVSPGQLNTSQKYFQKYGLWSLLLAWVPIIGDPLTLLAGVLNVRFGIFFLLVSISKISRYVFILYLASFV